MFQLKAKELNAFQGDSQFLKYSTVVTCRVWFHVSPAKTFYRLFLLNQASYQLEKLLLQLARGSSPGWCKKRGATTSCFRDLRSYKQTHGHTWNMAINIIDVQHDGGLLEHVGCLVLSTLVCVLQGAGRRNGAKKDKIQACDWYT